MEEIGLLTPYQVKNVFFRPKEADEPIGEMQSEKEIFWKVHKDWKSLSEEETQALWTKLQADKQRAETEELKEQNEKQG